VTTLGRVCAGLFTFGVVAGSMLPAGGGSHTPRAVGGYQILAADFHVHAFPGDGALAPWDLVREARREQLDVIAITNHNQMVAAHLAGRMRATPGVMVLPGEEVTTPGFHVTAVGLAAPVGWHGTIAEVAEAIHVQGGIAIGAHPAREFLPAFDASAFTALDGLERAHPMMESQEASRHDLADVFDRAKSVKPSIAPIGASDFHYTRAIGLDRTYVFVREITPSGVLDAMRAGRTVACDGRGNVYGAPGLSLQVSDLCRAAATARLTSSWRERMSLTCTWVGLLGLVVLGFRRRRATWVSTQS
jgi:hypothetical protein